jgi:hypothetical protein
MDLFFKHPRVARLWEKERQTDSYYGFFIDIDGV